MKVPENFDFHVRWSIWFPMREKVHVALVWGARADVRAALLMTLALRLFCSLIAALVPALLPDQYLLVNQLMLQNHNGVLVLPMTETLNAPSAYLIQPWARWDTNFFLQIAQEGYSAHGNTFFMPLYPVLIRLVGTLLGGQFLAAALLISTIATFGMLLCLYRLTEKLSSVAHAPLWALVVAILLPISFFLVAGYTEALFLWASFGALLAFLQRQWYRLAVLAALATITRHTGLLLSFLVVPPVIGMVWERIQAREAVPRERAPVLSLSGPLLAGAAGPLAYIAWAAVIIGVLHLPPQWVPLEASYGWNVHFTWPGAGVLADLAMVAHPALAISQGVGISALLLDAGAWIAGGVAIVLAARRLPAGLLLYAISCWCLAVMKVQNADLTVSAARYLLPLLPLAALPGEMLAHGPPWLRLSWVAIGSLLLLFCTWEFVLWAWVS